MGTLPPLGYDVRSWSMSEGPRWSPHIFRRFVELGSSTLLVKDPRLDGVTSKTWTTQDGRSAGASPSTRALIYKPLNNRTYLGELRHNAQWYRRTQPSHLFLGDTCTKIFTMGTSGVFTKDEATCYSIRYITRDCPVRSTCSAQRVFVWLYILPSVELMVSAKTIA
jgi:hypothetical protein